MNKLARAMNKLYTNKPSLKWWTPPPGEPVQMHVFTPYTPLRLRDFATYSTNTAHATDHAQIAATYALHTVDYPFLEARMTPWNMPHVCTHEGPWTLHSCRVCDVNEGKAIVALIAWLTGQQKVLDLLKPEPLVGCLHPGASIYKQCPECRWLIWKLNEAGHDMGSLDQYTATYEMRAWTEELFPRRRRPLGPTMHDMEILRAIAKRINFGDALPPYGMGYGGVR